MTSVTRPMLLLTIDTTEIGKLQVQELTVGRRETYVQCKRNQNNAGKQSFINLVVVDYQFSYVPYVTMVWRELWIIGRRQENSRTTTQQKQGSSPTSHISHFAFPRQIMSFPCDWPTRSFNLPPFSVLCKINEINPTLYRHGSIPPVR